VVELRYDRQHTYSPDLLEDQDVLNNRIQANGDYHIEHHFFNYSFSQTRSENVISTLTSRLNRHLFRWEGRGRVPNASRLVLTGRYSLNYASVTNEVAGTGPVLEIAPIAVGLYAQDDAPDLGTLDPRSGLADGNKIDPVLPLIDIGGGGNNHNLGADLGTGQAVAGIYIYTDRPSGNQPRWEVYGSGNNLNWQALPTSRQFFNPAFNRYEVTFAAANFRYVKAVNTGLNEIALVNITEIEVLRELPSGTDETGFSTASHSLDGRAGYKFNERWEGSLDVSLQFDENIGRAGDKSFWSLGWRLFFEPSEAVSHHFRWDVSRQGREAPQPTLVDNFAGYTMTLNPLETLRGSLSLSDRLSHFDGRRSQNILSSLLEGNATVFPDLNVSLGGGLSWFDDYIMDQGHNTWHVRGGVDAALSRSLDVVVDYNYSETSQDAESVSRTREFTSLGVDWRLTRDIYLRGALRYTAQRTEGWTQEYLVSWNLLRNMQVSAQLFEIESDGVTTNSRKSATLNWGIGSSSSLYLRLAEVDFSGTGGNTTESFQQGLRISF
jgi:hypothetical protein